jgi:hypothetical protein
VYKRLKEEMMARYKPTISRWPQQKPEGYSG